MIKWLYAGLGRDAEILQEGQACNGGQYFVQACPEWIVMVFCGFLGSYNIMMIVRFFCFSAGFLDSGGGCACLSKVGI